MKKLILLLVILLYAMQSMAQQITETQAQQIAASFFGIDQSKSNLGNKNTSTTSNENPFNNNSQLQLEYVVQSNGKNNIYIYNLTNGGFVIVAGDKRASKKVLGYSITGHIDAKNMSPTFKNLLEGYSKGIDALRESNAGNKNENTDEFIGNVIVEPLIKTKWDQKKPFYNLCPTYDNKRSLAGCVANAMAQIMNYYQWPKSGYGKNTNENDTTLMVDFSQSVYDWDNILDSYSENYTKEQANAVAKLMYDCGVAVNMDYSSEGSGAQHEHIESTMTFNFNYKTKVNLSSHDFETDTIFSSIKKECDAKHPLFIGGTVTFYGGANHEFICDGYAENDYFHFNFGWEGDFDGYYTLSIFVPYKEYVILSMIPNTDNEKTCLIQDNNLYLIKGDSVAVYAKNLDRATDINIPDFVIENEKKWPVVDIIDFSFYKCHNLESVTIGNSVTSIGYAAFFECNIDSITLGTNIKTIEDFAFYECPNLSYINIPNSVTSIGYAAFSECNIDSITLGTNIKTIGDFAFSGCQNLSYINIPNSVTSIGYRAFAKCNIDSITLGTNIKTIGDFAFYECPNLSYINIPNSVTSIGYAAFSECNIDSITLGTNIETIGDSAFYECSNILSIDIPNSVKTIGEHAFSYCNNLKSITIGNNVTDIGTNAFKNVIIKKADFVNNSSLDEIANNYWGAIILDNTIDGMYIIDNVLIKYIGDAKQVVIPNYVTEIGSYAFADNSNLSSIEIPISVKSIGEGAFENCNNLNSVTLGSSIEIIEENAFAYSGLSSIEIPNSVKSIGKGAFEKCNNLNSVTLGSGIETIEENVFTYSGLSSIEIPNSVKSIGKGAFENCNNLNSVTLGSGIETIEENAFAYSGLSSIEIPNSVTSINNNAFGHCQNLMSIDIGNNVANVGYSAFYECRISKENFINHSILDEESNNYWGAIITDYIVDDMYIINNVLKKYYGDAEHIVIPNSVITIGNSAFIDCTSIKSIILSNSVTNIEIGAFYNCSNLSDIEFSNSLTTIDNYAFSLTGLTSINFPSSLEKIGDGVFMYCSALNSVFIPKSVTSIEEFTFYGCDNLSIYCEAESKGEKWNNKWHSNSPVVWGAIPPKEIVLATDANSIANVNIYTKSNTIVVENAKSEISVFDMMGRLLVRKNNITDVVEIQMPTGIYIVKTCDKSQLIYVR